MSHNSATYIIINPKYSHASLFDRFPQTISLARRKTLRSVPHHEPISPAGSSAVSSIYEFGHPGKRLQPLTELTVDTLRQLRSVLNEGRQSGKTLHVFGIIDNDSPHGSRRMLETIIRMLGAFGGRVFIHLGVWHPTPREFLHGMQELHSLSLPNVRIGSIFPIQSMHNPQVARKYVDGIRHPAHVHRSFTQPELPLRQPHFFSSIDDSPNNMVLMLNHSLHGLDILCDALSEAGYNVRSCESKHISSDSISRALDKNRHIMAVTNRPTYASAYFGHEIQHPYFESYIAETGHEALEMLISPHFGAGITPFRTVVLLDESTHQFDWLLHSYLRQQYQKPFYCCWLQPEDLNGHIIFTNMPLTDSQSLHAQLHQFEN